MAEQVKENLVTLTIDDIEVSVPAGTVVVDAAKMAGIDIPVFCYHPKMEPVGMCRMCLVDVGYPVKDRETGEAVLEEDGSPKIQFGRALMTGCTQVVSEGMVVVGYSEKVQKARKDILELFLTSHPLDCPICDKGGECPLQNLTMEHGPGTSRFIYDEKKHNLKHVPLGELIFLDRERCIHCARCTRFQSEVADDPVIGFFNRGRSLEIRTYSEPGFDSIWSGNTTDICPVGALTTADFRFSARPWEMLEAASVCNHCPVGCNLTLNTRREAKSSGNLVVKRVMPRQNEMVNETWLCDKGRFGYHFSDAAGRLSEPMVRKDGELTPVSWDEAYDLVAEKFKAAGKDLFTLASGRLSNEDLFNLGQMAGFAGGKAALYSDMMGGDLTAKVGVGQGTNLSDLGEGDAIFVVASDLEEEAPLYWLRVKQAAERGATLIVANPRQTKLDAKANFTLRYAYGQEAAVVMALLNTLSPKQPELSDDVKNLAKEDAVKDAAKAFAEAANAVVLFGSEGVGLAGSDALSKACANLLVATGHTGMANNGLIGVWDKGNVQGAWDMGLEPSISLIDDVEAAKAVYLVGVDPAAYDGAFKAALEAADFVVVQELHDSETAQLADVVLPVQAFTEREGTSTNGERHVQRYYPAVPPVAGTKPDFKITAEICTRMGKTLEGSSAVMVFLQLVGKFADYADLDYQALAEVSEQWPIMGREDLFYGGTSYANKQGMGVQLNNAAGRGESVALNLFDLPAAPAVDSLLAVPVTRLYDQGSSLQHSAVLHPRLPEPFIVVAEADAAELGLNGSAKVAVGGDRFVVAVIVDETLPQGVALVPRRMGLPLDAPGAITVEKE